MTHPLLFRTKSEARPVGGALPVSGMHVRSGILCTVTLPVQGAQWRTFCVRRCVFEICVLHVEGPTRDCAVIYTLPYQQLESCRGALSL